MNTRLWFKHMGAAAKNDRETTYCRGCEKERTELFLPPTAPRLARWKNCERHEKEAKSTFAGLPLI